MQNITTRNMDEKRGWIISSPFYFAISYQLFYVVFFLYNGDMFLKKTTLSLKTSIALSNSSIVFMMPKEKIRVPCAAA